jgi:hypothetical protein
MANLWSHSTSKWTPVTLPVMYKASLVDLQDIRSKFSSVPTNPVIFNAHRKTFIFCICLALCGQRSCDTRIRIPKGSTKCLWIWSWNPENGRTWRALVWRATQEEQHDIPQSMNCTVVAHYVKYLSGRSYQVHERRRRHSYIIREVHENGRSYIFLGNRNSLVICVLESVVLYATNPLLL